MSRTYENPNQAIYDTLIELRAEAIQTNNLLNLILEALRMPRDSGDSTEGK